MLEVGAYATRREAELPQTALAAAGIPSVRAADNAGGVYPFDPTPPCFAPSGTHGDSGSR